MLSLQVGPFNPADLAKGASLTLRLLPNADPAAALAQALAPEAASAGPGAPGRLELILNAVQLPLSSINLKVTETLAQLGAPVDRASIQNAAQATVALLGSESGAQVPGQGPSLLANPTVQSALRDGLAQLQVAAQFNPSSQNVLILQQAVRAIGQALEQGGLQPSATPPAPSAAPAESHSVPGPLSSPPLNPAQAQAGLSQALAALAADPSPQNLQNLQGLLGSLAAAQAPEGALSHGDSIGRGRPPPGRAAVRPPGPGGDPTRRPARGRGRPGPPRDGYRRPGPGTPR